MLNEFSRSELLLGEDKVSLLKHKRVAVFGVGGVGGYVVEGLARTGVGSLDLIDNDTVSLTNINRQIIALHSTIGKDKVEVMRDRVLDINPNCKVNIHKTFYLPETAGEFDFREYDYIVDAIDTVAGKLMLIEEAKRCGTPIICSLGAGNHLDPLSFKVSDISKTSMCPLAKVMRHELKKRNIKDVKVVYSTEEPIRTQNGAQNRARICSGEVSTKRSIPGSIAYVPSVVGLIICSEVIKDLTK